METKTGRPSEYTDDKARIICEQLAEGIPLAEICRAPDMPHPSTVRRWADKNEELSRAIACAREDGEERITADLRKVAKGEAGFTTGDIQRDKLVIDTDLKLLAKWNPKKYGERIQNDIVVRDGDASDDRDKAILDHYAKPAE